MEAKSDHSRRFRCGGTVSPSDYWWPHCIWSHDPTPQLGTQFLPSLCSSQWCGLPWRWRWTSCSDQVLDSLHAFHSDHATSRRYPTRATYATSWKIVSEGRGPIKYPHRMCCGWQPFGPLRTWDIKDNDLYMCLSSWTVPDTANSTQYLSHTAKSTTTVPLRTLSGFRSWWQPQSGSRPCTESARLLVERGRCLYPSPVVSAGGFNKIKVDQCFPGYFCPFGGTFGSNSSRVRLMLEMNGLMVEKTMLFCNSTLPLPLAAALLRMEMKQRTHCNWCKGLGLVLRGGSSSPPPVLAVQWALSLLMSFTFQLSTALSPSTELLLCLSFNSSKAFGNGQRTHTQLHCTRWKCHIFEQAPDRSRQVTATDQLILLDIEIYKHGATTPGKHIRRVIWSRRLMNRQAMLSSTASVSLCEAPGTTCELSINRHVWVEGDTANRHVLHGDFIRLRIDAASPSEELHMALCDQEFADAQRYVFGRSPSRSPTPSDSVLHAEGSSEEVASPSLLQLSATVTSLASFRHSDHRVIADRSRINERLKGANEPHVHDLWCAPSSPSDPLGFPDQRPVRHHVTLADKIEGPTNLRIPCGHLEFLRTQILDADLGPVLDRGQVVKWHDATLQAFATTPDWDGEPVHCYSFYTDGSSIRTADGRVGASAVVLILHTEQGARFGGIRAYSVPGWATAPRSEALAMLLALLWAHQVGHLHPNDTPFRVDIGYDCLSAGHAAAGQWAIRSNVDIQHHCRALTQWLHQRFGECITFYHIASHTGHAWNECVDAVTWSVVNGWMGSCLPIDVLQQLTLDNRHPTLTSWLWMLEASLQGAPGGPRIDNNSFVIDVAAPFKTAPSAAGHPIMVRQHQEPHVKPGSMSDVILSAATANVLTLYPGGERPGAYVSARHEQLMRQCSDQGLHIVGVQETRSRLNGYYEGVHYHVISAPASSAGVGGTQLWISRVFKFGLKEFTVSHRWIQVFHSTSQSLCVAFGAPWLRLMIVVGHAPSGGDEPSEAFWRTLTHGIPQSHRLWPTVYLLDANARVGTIHSEAIGSWGATEEKSNGELFHQWLIDNRLFLPQTFEAHHSGPHDTWEHGRGVRARLDYVALDESLRHPSLRTSVLEDLDLGIQRLDHMAVRADIPLRVADIEATKRVKSSRNAMKSSRIASTGLIPWQVDVHTHATLLAQQTSTHGSGTVWKRKTHLQDDTWTLIQWKRYHWKRCNQLRTAIGQSKMRLWFRAWKHVRHAGCTEEGASWFHQAHIQYAFHSHHLSRLAPLVAQQVKKRWHPIL